VRLPHIGECTGYVVGYRAWAFRSERLTSMVKFKSQTEWIPGMIVEANDCIEDHPYGYGPGIYALKSEQNIIWSIHGLPESDMVFGGAVALWGDITEHAEGYRGQYAYPIDFCWCTHPRALRFLGALTRAFEQEDLALFTNTMDALQSLCSDRPAETMYTTAPRRRIGSPRSARGQLDGPYLMLSPRLAQHIVNRRFAGRV